MYRKRRKYSDFQISVLELWDAAERNRKALVERAQKVFMEYLDPADWCFIFIGDKTACANCYKRNVNCICPGGPVIRRDHEILNLGDVRQNIGNALVDLAGLGGIPEGTIIVTKVKKPLFGSMLGYKLVTHDKIVQVPLRYAEDYVQWDRVASILEGRCKIKNRTAIYAEELRRENL